MSTNQNDKNYKVSMTNTANWLMKRTCQIFYINPKNHLKEAIATGMLMNLQGKKILLSTGHTFTKENCSSLYVYSADGAIQITGHLFLSSPIDAEERANDKIDFGYLVLDKDTSDWLEARFEFITWNNIKENHLPESGQNYLAFGYPYRKTDIKKAGKGDIFFQPLTLHTTGSEPRYYINEFNEQEHILVKLNRKLKIVGTNQKGKMPKLEGMSGGGLWHLPKPTESTPPMRLVGILMEYNSENIQVSKIDNFLKFLKLHKYHVNIKQ